MTERIDDVHARRARGAANAHLDKLVREAMGAPPEDPLGNMWHARLAERLTAVIASVRDEAEDRAKAAEEKLRAAERLVEQLRARLALKASMYTAEEQAADRAEVLAWDFEKGEPR